MLSHELRSPLQSLLLNIDLCIQRAQSPDIARDPAWLAEKLTRQRRMAARLKLLIDTFLDVGHITAGHLRFELEELDLGELARDALDRCADDLAWARCPCRLDIQPGVIGHWDRLQLELVIANLLSNAFKYGAGAPIELAVWGTADTAFLRVTDHGPGIAPADHGRVFEKFTRLPSPSRVGGFGLGLWIVRNVVEAGGGKITLDSAPGRGASFVISLPRSS
jgi:signal transduction histidine kinase